MRKTLALFIFLCLSGVFLLPQKSFAADYNIEKLFYLSQAKEAQGILDIKKNHSKIDILAPQVYGISSNLKIAGGLSKNLRKVVKDYNLKVMPLMANSGFKRNTMHNLLVSEKGQNNLIAFMVAEAKANNFIGWQFDFENISYKDKDSYSAFIEKTAKELHKNGLLFSVAAVVRTVDYEDTDAFKNWSGVFDYKRIASAVDFISLMTYDDANSFGPCASVPFINSVLNYVKDKIPPEKLSMGIPVYYWGWTISPYKRIRSGGSWQRVQNIKNYAPWTAGFLEALGVPWFSYASNSQRYLIWYEDKKSFSLKLDIVKSNKFRGFSAWVLGDEDPAIWTAL